MNTNSKNQKSYQNANFSFEFTQELNNVTDNRYLIALQKINEMMTVKYQEKGIKEITFYDEYIDFSPLFRGKIQNDEKYHYSDSPIGVIFEGQLLEKFIPETVGRFTGIYDETPWSYLSQEKQLAFYNSLLKQLKKYSCEAKFSHCRSIWRGVRVFEGDTVLMLPEDLKNDNLKIGKVVFDNNKFLFNNSLTNDQLLLSPRRKYLVVTQ